MNVPKQVSNICCFRVVGFLEFVNNMLALGAIPSLFSEEEREALLAEIQNEATQAGCKNTKEAAWNYFLRKAGSNLHVVLNMSPVRLAKRTRIWVLLFCCT